MQDVRQGVFNCLKQEVYFLPFLLYFCSFASRISFAMTLLVALVFCAMLYHQYNFPIEQLLIILISTIFSYYDPIFLIFLLFILAEISFLKDFKKKYISFVIFIYLLISIAPLPLFTGVIYFYGMPFIICISIILLFFLNKYNYSVLKNKLTVIILLVLSVEYGYLYITNNREHIGISTSSTDETLSENFMCNSILTKQWQITKQNTPVLNNSKTNGLYSYFLIDWEKGTESQIKKSNMKGTFYLYGEHDNLNNFVDDDSVFNNNNIQQRTPWMIFKPTMIRSLWSASVLDPFYCSNIGATIKRKSNMFPLAWNYTYTGMPQLLIAMEIQKDKIIIYLGDTDPAVKFLASYNSAFLNALYLQPSINNLYKITLLCLCASLIILTKRFKGIIMLCFCLSMLPLTFVNFNLNKNNFDYCVIDKQKIVSPHISNHPGFITNQISQSNFTVFLGHASNVKKYIIRLVPTNKTVNVRSKLDNLKTIFFLAENSKIKIGEDEISANNIPLGTTENVSGLLSIIIPDARELLFNNIKSKDSIIKIGSCYFIGTGSPQRFIDYGKLK